MRRDKELQLLKRIMADVNSYEFIDITRLPLNKHS